MKNNKENEQLMQDICVQSTNKPADTDSKFLHSYEARSVRLQLDYLKAEEKMKEFGIKYTIVVFGSARIKEEDQIRAELKESIKTLDPIKEKDALIHAEKKADILLKQSVYYDEARKLGQIVGQSGSGSDDCSLTLMTGGGAGIMEAANRGAHDVGAKSIGLNIQLPHEQHPNPYITPELCFQFHYFSMRKLHFLLRANSLVIFPGVYGTLDEMFEILTMVQTKKHEPIPIIFVGNSYWEKLINFDTLLEEYMISPEDYKLFHYVESADEAWQSIISWYSKNNTSLI